MGMRMPETCWAVFKRQVVNLRDWCIWLVDLFEYLNAVWIRLLYKTWETERSDRTWTVFNTRWGFVYLVMNLDVCHRQWKFVQITSSALETGCMSGRNWAAENGSTWRGSSCRLQVSWKHQADITDCSSSGVTGQVRVISQRSCNLITTRALRRDKQLHAVRIHP